MKEKFNKMPKVARLVLFGAIALLFVCCVIVGVISSNDDTNTPQKEPSVEVVPTVEPTKEPSKVDKYMEEYGGNPDVYERILSMTDCNNLQAEFDQASENNDREEPGTPQFKWTLGYMNAANERMKELGCITN